MQEAGLADEGDVAGAGPGTRTQAEAEPGSKPKASADTIPPVRDRAPGASPEAAAGPGWRREEVEVPERPGSERTTTAATDAADLGPLHPRRRRGGGRPRGP